MTRHNRLRLRHNNPMASLIEQMKPLGMTLSSGIVSAVNGDGTIDFDVDGVTIPDVPFIGETDPTVGEELWAFRTGTTVLPIKAGGGDFLPLAGGSLTGNLNMGGNVLSNPADPTLGTHVGDRDYNDARNDGRYLSLGGGTLTGTLTSRALIPSAHGTYDIGVTGTRYRHLYLSGDLFAAVITATNEFQASAFGTLADPTYSWTSDNSIGFYRLSSGVIGVAGQMQLGTSGAEVRNSNGNEVLPGTLTSFTPVLRAATTNPNLGSGGNFLQWGRWMRVGDLVHVWVHWGFGSTGASAGSGIYSIEPATDGLPAVDSSFGNSVQDQTCGSLWMKDQDSQLRYIGTVVRQKQTADFIFLFHDSSTQYVVDNDSPTVWGEDGDFISLYFVYPTSD